MPDVKTKATKKLSDDAIVPPFGIEADHPRNADLLIQGILDCRLRSAIKPTKLVFDRDEGEQIERPADAKMFDGLPASLPGMQLHVNPQEGTYAVVDPIDERTLERVKQVIDRRGFRTRRELKPAKGSEGTLNKDQMKTLVREMCSLVKEGHAKVVKGSLPEEIDVEDLPGDFLLNPANRSQWNQPRYEKDLDQWNEKMNSLRD